MSKIVLFQTILFSVIPQFSSIWLIDRAMLLPLNNHDHYLSHFLNKKITISGFKYIKKPPLKTSSQRLERNWHYKHFTKPTRKRSFLGSGAESKCSICSTDILHSDHPSASLRNTLTQRFLLCGWSSYLGSFWLRSHFCGWRSPLERFSCDSTTWGWSSNVSAPRLGPV